MEAVLAMNNEPTFLLHFYGGSNLGTILKPGTVDFVGADTSPSNHNFDN
jgi:1,6-anhydro-N-acetylmuramate kinase